YIPSPQRANSYLAPNPAPTQIYTLSLTTLFRSLALRGSERAPEPHVALGPAGRFESLGNADAQLRAQEVPRARFIEQLHAPALVPVLRSIVPGRSRLGENAHRDPVDPHRGDHEMAVDVGNRNPPLQSGEARAMPGEHGFSAPVAAQRKLALVEHRQCKCFLRK